MSKLLKIASLLLLLAAIVLSIYSVKEVNDLKSKNSNLETSLKTANQNIEGNKRLAFSFPYQAYSLRRLAYDSNTNMLYLPELRLKVPYTEPARSLLYGLRTDESGKVQEADVTTDAYMPPQEETTLDCSAFLSLRFEDTPNPRNPAEKLGQTIKLQDGRTLQVYYFTGDLEGNNQCKKTYQPGTLPSDFVKAFKSAGSY